MKTSEAKKFVPLPATSGHEVKTPTSLTVDLASFEFTKICLGRRCSYGSTIEDALKREETAQLTAFQTTTGSYFGTVVAK